jgi:salicylate hydroxylase
MNGYDMYRDIDQAFAERRGMTYTGSYVKGLPFGLKLSNGVTIDQNVNF